MSFEYKKQEEEFVHKTYNVVRFECSKIAAGISVKLFSRKSLSFIYRNDTEYNQFHHHNKLLDS